MLLCLISHVLRTLFKSLTNEVENGGKTVHFLWWFKLHCIGRYIKMFFSNFFVFSHKIIAQCYSAHDVSM